MSVIKSFTVRIFLLRGWLGCFAAKHEAKYQLTISLSSTNRITGAKDHDLIFSY